MNKNVNIDKGVVTITLYFIFYFVSVQKHWKDPHEASYSFHSSLSKTDFF